MKKLFTFLVIFTYQLKGQNRNFAIAEAANNNFGYNIKFSCNFLINGGYNFGAGIGTWKKFNTFQPSTNISLNFVQGRNNLGNRNRKGKGSNRQTNLIISPMLTIGANKRGYPEFINPFYLGNTGAVISDYCSSFTIGTNFITLPRGERENSFTSRNRTQQLIFLQAKAGLDSSRNITLNFYEDFVIFTNWFVFKGLADNYDRFYTGGGNVQVRLNNKTRFSIYSEIYTGTFNKDLFDYPDLYNPNHTIGCGEKLRGIRTVAQEAGQKLFNSGRTLFGLEHSVNNYQTITSFLGRQDGPNQMKPQNWFHDATKIARPINSDADNLYKYKGSDKAKLASIHRFTANYEEPKWVFGLGYDYYISK